MQETTDEQVERIRGAERRSAAGGATARVSLVAAGSVVPLTFGAESTM
jgi:hypothetical protein